MSLKEAVDAVMDRKRDLESAILKAVQSFEQETGTCVTSVYIRRSNEVGGRFNKAVEIASEVMVGNNSPY